MLATCVDRAMKSAVSEGYVVPGRDPCVMLGVEGHVVKMPSAEKLKKK